MRREAAHPLQILCVAPQLTFRASGRRGKSPHQAINLLEEALHLANHTSTIAVRLSQLRPGGIKVQRGQLLQTSEATPPEIAGHVSKVAKLRPEGLEFVFTALSPVAKVIDDGPEDRERSVGRMGLWTKLVQHDGSFR